MTVEKLHPNQSPVATVPADLDNSAQLFVYDGYPSSENWARDILARAQVCGHARDLEALEALTQLELGAPLGSFSSESYRVSRAVGLIAPLDAGDSTAGLRGVCIAQGLCHATWKHTETADFLVVRFIAPTSFGWGAGKSSLSQEYLKARCLQQFAHQAHSLLKNIADCGSATAVVTEFVGAWGPETDYIRRGLTTTCLLYWKTQVSTREHPQYA
jgi:hypothetical protein